MAQHYLGLVLRRMERGEVEEAEQDGSGRNLYRARMRLEAPQLGVGGAMMTEEQVHVEMVLAGEVEIEASIGIIEI